jgi:hypothetical protein
MSDDGSVASGYLAADLIALASAARRMRRCWYLAVEKNDIGTVKRVLNCNGSYHAHLSDWREAWAGGLTEPVIQSRAIAARCSR